MTLTPNRIGDKGQRYEVKFLLKDEVTTLGFSQTAAGADRMIDVWSQHPTKPYVWAVDRKIMLSAPIRNVGNFRKEGLPAGAIMVDRTSPWGNPKPLVAEGFRRSCLVAFTEYAGRRMRTDPAWRSSVLQLKGKPLICWCAPRACHADVLQCLAEGAMNDGHAA